MIQAVRDDNTVAVIEPISGDLWGSAQAGTLGEIAAYTPPQEPTEAEKLEAWRNDTWCSPMQGKLALGENEWAKVEAMVADPDMPFAMRIAITSATRWNRNSQMMDELAWLMNYTPEQVDDLFRAAMNVTV
jgi:hypothetical protein